MWDFLDNAPVIPLRIRNELLGVSFPSDAPEVLAVLDTGYSGFLLIPQGVFAQLRLTELRPTRSEGVLTDGSVVHLVGAYGSIEVPSLGLEVDGLIHVHPGASEILLGMDGIRRLRVEMDCCERRLYAEVCSE